MTPSRPLLFGHRGAAGEAPENTRPGFRIARELGLDGIELDVLQCASGEIVAAHDLTLQRIAGKKRPVKSYTYDELNKLDVGSHFSEQFAGERIPRLEEVLDEFGAMWLDIEIKGRSMHSDGIEEKIIRLLQERKLVEKVILSSFNPFIVRRIQVMAPEFKVGFNFLQDGYGPLRKIWFRPLAPPFSLHPQPAQVDQAFMDYAKNLRARVMPWGVNEPKEIQRLLELGVHGLLSDYPSRLSAMIPTGP